MKRKISLMMTIFLAAPLIALADNPRPGRDDNSGGKNPPSRPSRPAASPRVNAAPSRQPVIINMSHPSSGGHNQNFPSQQSVPQPQVHAQPSYGRLQWNAPATNRPQPRVQPQGSTNAARPSYTIQSRPSNPQAYAAPGQRAAVAVHHHPYAPGYVRKKLQKIGVAQEPALITNRAEIIHTSRQYSTIRFPQHGPNKAPLAATAISPRHFNDPIVRDHMTLVDTAGWHDRIQGFNASETERNHYYWHTDNSFNYCHYIDNQGYHWWGWYVGGSFFWNRYYAGRWWWYDSDYDRWCFWNEGFWWWQDPYHVDDLYCYNNDSYIPCNSANDQVVVTAPADQTYQVYNAPDNSCQIKVMSGTQDAFLYDTDATDADSARQPVYLASGVESVQFSDTSTGRPLQIILKLNDGTFDMFDDDGNSYGPGNFDADQADNGAYNPPPDGTAAPPDNSMNGN